MMAIAYTIVCAAFRSQSELALTKNMVDSFFRASRKLNFNHRKHDRSIRKPGSIQNPLLELWLARASQSRLAMPAQLM
jgi:hypothetical protein